MPDGPVVSNNTPLVALAHLGRLDLLQELFGTVLIPTAVHHEFLGVDQRARRELLENSSWLGIARLKQPRRVHAYRGLDQGEAETLALAEEKEARLVLIDEKKGRAVAHRMGFPLLGTLGILLLAKEKMLLPSIGKEVKKLQKAGIYLRAALVTRVLAMADEG